MKTSLIRKQIDSEFGAITVECQSQNTSEGAVNISHFNDTVVISESALPKLVEHLNKLIAELDL